MMSNKGDDVKRLMCPYNAVHLILPHRMQQHLVKCRQQHQDLQREICPNNATHVIPTPEMPFHMENCPDRQNMDKFLFTSSSSENKYPIPTLSIEPTEIWEEDNCPTYNPEVHCLSKPILRNRNGLTPAQRKKFKLEERQRMQQFHTQEMKPTPIEFEQKQTQKLRRPHGISMAAGNENCVDDADEMSHLLHHINLESHTVAYPKMAPKQLDENKQVSYAQMSGPTPSASIKKNVGRGRGLAQRQN